jgi:hypothetical protein
VKTQKCFYVLLSLARDTNFNEDFMLPLENNRLDLCLADPSLKLVSYPARKKNFDADLEKVFPGLLREVFGTTGLDKLPVLQPSPKNRKYRC